MNFGSIALPKPFHGTTPKPMRIAAPKIASLHVARMAGGGLTVNHLMHGAPTKTFKFQDPSKAIQHIRKIQSGEWRQPYGNLATAMDRTMDIDT